ncbi:trypsin-like peptidase domain-containing protein [Paenibacillus thiaminolyticus]|uniref:S1C family serine protease n=1 Tax=Paenibacillus thiaminolyticus TaxID=49283 RepID=UPI00232BDBDE|nr:trypsin-like peptidase domain-containing protein [Paenibacillus thiaminolyticus]WCF07458.1 trypsin-like peptidase domain-containing protein [Paenibacillus thiaminolyticus]
MNPSKPNDARRASDPAPAEEAAQRSVPDSSVSESGDARGVPSAGWGTMEERDASEGNNLMEVKPGKEQAQAKSTEASSERQPSAMAQRHGEWPQPPGEWPQPLRERPQHGHSEPLTAAEFEQWIQEDEEEETEPAPRRKWMAKTITLLLALLLFGNVLAFWPQIYNLPALRFLHTDKELSQSEQIQQYKQAVVIVNAHARKGTGFNVAAEGIIITNRHVMAEDKTGSVTFQNNKTYLADVVASDAALDVAVLKLRDNSEPLPALPLETDSGWREGAQVHIIGNPLSFYHIAIEGSILGLTPLQHRERPVLMIQAPVHSGNSGSPVLNEQGRVIGVVFATTTVKQGEESEESIQVGLAIPIEDVRPYLNESGQK